jgi:hypothetical protein
VNNGVRSDELIVVVIIKIISFHFHFHFYCIFVFLILFSHSVLIFCSRFSALRGMVRISITSTLSVSHAAVA